MKASPQLSDHLQALLVDLIELSLQSKQIHWNIVGPNFRDLHLHLDEVVAQARPFADRVAERLRALDGIPDGRGATVVDQTSLRPAEPGIIMTTAAVSAVSSRLHETVATARRIHDEVDAEDPTTADLLHEVIDTLEKLLWMTAAEHPGVQSSLE